MLLAFRSLWSQAGNNAQECITEIVVQGTTKNRLGVGSDCRSDELQYEIISKKVQEELVQLWTLRRFETVF